MSESFANAVKRRAVEPLALVALIWVTSFAGFVFPAVVERLALQPRTASGLLGILTMPLVHGSRAHLAINTASLIVLAAFVALEGPRKFIGITAAICLVGGGLLWLTGRDALHVGASGLVFGYFGFLVIYGFYDRRIRSIAVTFIVAITYGGLLVGVVPNDLKVSWEGHLCGLLAGGGIARLLVALRKTPAASAATRR